MPRRSAVVLAQCAAMPTVESLLSAAPALPVVWADATAIVIDKPPGLPSVPGRNEALKDCAAARVQVVWPEALVVHRLDMATSGLLLFARGTHWQRVYSKRFAAREMHKRYVAVVHGLMPHDHGDIDLPLIADWPRRPRQKVDHDTGKPSLTRYDVIARDPIAYTTRVELSPVTGRSHQLRVHLMAIGHPIVGDTLYGTEAAAPPASRLLLHAQGLAFSHPSDGHPVSLDMGAPF